MARIVLVLFLITIVSDVIAQSNDDWVVLAKKDVSYKADKDVLTLIGNERNVEKIKLNCTQGSLKIKKTRLIYGSADHEEHKPKGTGILTKGTSSIPIKVSNDKQLKKVEIEYEAYGNVLLTKRAKVEVLGLKHKK